MTTTPNKKDKTLKSKNQTYVKTPTVLQMEAVECGAAALSIILSYYGRIVPLEELRALCGVSRDGAKASNIVKVARDFGLKAKGFRKEPEALRDLPLPVIIFWNFNHFLVVEGFAKNGRVYLNDPATGRRTVSVEEFDQSFTGVVLTFEPGPTFEPGGDKPSLIRALQRRLPGSETALTYVILAGLALVVPGLIIPTFIRIFVDEVLTQSMTSWFIPLLFGMLIMMVMNGFLTWLKEIYLLRFETKLALSTSSKYFWHVLRLPIEFFTQRYIGDIGDRVAINDHVAHLLSGELATTVINVITVLFYLVIMISYSLWLTLVGVVIATLNLMALQLTARNRVDASRKLVQEQGKFIGAAMGGLQNIESLKATGMEADFFSRWAGYQAKTINATQEVAKYGLFLQVVSPFLSTLNTTIILTLGGYFVMTGQMTMGMLIAFYGLMLNFLAPFNKLVNLGSVFQEVQGDMARLDDVLQYPVDRQFKQDQPVNLDVENDVDAEERINRLLTARTGQADENDTNKASITAEYSTRLVQISRSRKLAGKVELQNVTFGYNRLSPPLVKNLSLTIKPGARVALVGGSGSGKSTVARLVAGLYEPWKGEILFDGWPRHEIQRSVITNSLSMVDQELFLFAGTVRDNLAMWDKTIPETYILQAAKDATIHDVIAARPGGYESMVAEGGRNYSGGQRQRLEIARALVTNPAVLILDEATSALDPTTEQIIDENLRRRGCTCLIVAHRLSTIRDCDEIIVMEHGKVVQRGTHDKMYRKRNSPYTKLIQAESMEPDKSKSKSLLDMLY